MHQLSVLVVDDNKRVLGGLERAMRRRGFVPLSCSTFAEATDRIRDADRPMAAALIDVWLGRGGDGFDLVRQLRHRFGVSAYCALMSGYQVETQLVAQAEELDASFLSKPIAAENLTMFLSQAIAQSLLPQPTLRGAVLGFVRDHQLSPQETRVIAKLATGTRRSELADALSLSPDTLKWQVRSILAKASLPSTEHVVSDVLRRATRDV